MTVSLDTFCDIKITTYNTFHCALARGEGRQIIEGGSPIWQTQMLSVSSYFVDYHVIDCSVVHVKSIFS